MVTMYDERKMLTIRDVLEKTSGNFKFIQKFEYGDFDNWRVALLCSIDIPLEYVHEREETIGDLKHKYYSISLKHLYKDVDDVNKNGFNNAKIYCAYGTDFNIIDINNLLNKKIEVVGEWIKE